MITKFLIIIIKLIMNSEQYLINTGLQLFKERYPRNVVPDDWDIPKEYTHSVIGCKQLFLKNIKNRDVNTYYFKIDMWFDSVPMITLTLYEYRVNAIIEETVVFNDYKYDTMIDAVEILMGSFNMSLDSENLQLLY